MDASHALSIAVRCRAELDSRRADVAKFESYYRGDQPLTFASDEWSHLHKQRYRNFSDNWCGVVGSAPVERLEIRGFRLDNDAVTSDAERTLWSDWDYNEGGAQASQGFLTSTIAKRSFALVWGTRDNEPVLTWERPDQVLVTYDPETRARRAAIKCWADGDVEFLTLYTPTEVWKWQRPRTAGYSHGQTTSGGIVIAGTFAGDGAWVPRQGEGDDTWPIRNPMGVVPIVEFANRPMLGGEAMSDIEGTVAMQDAINLLWAYLFVAADYASMPARVVMGQAPPKIPVLDNQGQQVGERDVDHDALKKGRMLWLTGQGASIGQWDAAKLDVFTDTINVSVRHIAAQTRTPIYLVHGELGNVNGETLTGLDAPLVSKVGEAQKSYRRGVRDVFALMALARGNKAVAAQARLGVVDWADPAIYSVSQLADAESKDKGIGLPLAHILETRRGYTQPQIDRVLGQVKAESADPYLDRLAAKDAAAPVE